MDGDTLMDGNILYIVYPEDKVLVQGYHYYEDERAIEVTCKVPATPTYTHFPISFATEEHFGVCVRQAVYLLTNYLLGFKLIPRIRCSVDDFRATARASRVLGSRVFLTIQKTVPVETEFTLRLTFSKSQVTRQPRAIILEFSIGGDTVSGNVVYALPRR